MLIDMPLNELKTYRGINECPQDLDAFWDREIAAMESLGTSCELVPSAFQVPGARCYDLWFRGVGGSRIHCKFLRPETVSGKIPAVCHFHGYSGRSDDFSHYLNWVCAGFAVAAMDCRGQAGLSEDLTPVPGNTLHGHIIRGLDGPDPTSLYFRNVFLDAAQMARIVMAMDLVDETRVGAFGGSQGGALTYACAALTPTLNSAAPCVAFLSDYRRVWEMDLDIQAYSELKEYLRSFDPEHKRVSEIFTRLGYIDNHNLAHRIRARILTFVGLMDTVCPPSTQFAIYNNLTSPKEMRLFPDFAHEGMPGETDATMQFMLQM